VSGTPEISYRTEQPCVVISDQLAMSELGTLADRLGEVFGWLAARDVPPAGPPFFRYNVIDMDRQLQVEAGVPVQTPVPGEGEVNSGVIPAGRYATLIHVGPPASLEAATATLLDWAAQQGLRWDVTESGDGEHWGARLEYYLTDPSEQPDMTRWETLLAFRLAD
jgi:effector-binding domain-containing protein